MLNSSWIVMGDFNLINNSNDKDGGIIASQRKCEELNKFQFDCNLMVADFKRQSFTWINRRMGKANVCKRIDRVLVNIEGNICFSNFSFIHETIKGSDHCPFIVHFDRLAKKSPFKFKFESSWTTFEHYKECVRGVELYT